MSSKVLIVNLAVFIALLGILEFGLRSFKSNPKSKTQLTLQDNPRPSTSVPFTGLPGIRPVPEKYQDKFAPELSAYPKQKLDKNYSSNFFDSKKIRKSGDYRVTAKIIDSDVTVFDVTYKIDEFGRRFVENQDQKQASRFVLAFGCSFTFGEGLPQGQDYPSQLAEKLDPSWKVYNFGEIGGSSNDSLDHLRAHPEKYLAGIAESEGIWIWNFLPDHLIRFLCPWICYSDQYAWIHPKTEYVLEGDSLVAKGSFNNSHDPVRMLLQFLSKSMIVQSVGYKVPPLHTPYELDLFVKSLQEISNSLKNKNITKKYVLFDHKFKGYPIFKSLLKKYGFEPVELFQLRKQIKMKHATIPVDGHPSAEFNWYLTELLKNRIETDFQ